jgi:hypothetical protein
MNRDQLKTHARTLDAKLGELEELLSRLDEALANRARATRALVERFALVGRKIATREYSRNREHSEAGFDAWLERSEEHIELTAHQVRLLTLQQQNGSPGVVPLMVFLQMQRNEVIMLLAMLGDPAARSASLIATNLAKRIADGLAQPTASALANILGGVGGASKIAEWIATRKQRKESTRNRDSDDLFALVTEDVDELAGVINELIGLATDPRTNPTYADLDDWLQQTQQRCPAAGKESAIVGQARTIILNLKHLHRSIRIKYTCASKVRCDH